jgi:radical SAM superfamily enzyme YgiQ (UPF0313 family)
MKITFLIPPSKNKIPERIYGCSYQIHSEPELPILYVASVLEKEKYNVDFRDFTLEDNSDASFEEFIKNSDCDIFIFHSVFLSKDIDVPAAKKIRHYKKNAYILFFGPEPTRVPEKFIFDRKVIVARGEPEIIIKNLVDSLTKGANFSNLKGISFIKDGAIIHNETFGIIEDLDSLPFPARNLIKKYQRKFYNAKIPSKPHTLILTSRGCAFRCYFCVPNAISWARELEWRKYHKNEKPPLKLRSAENILDEFKDMKSQGYKSAWIMDDMFLWGKERSAQILDGIKETGIEFGILARADFICENIAKKLKEADCKIVDMGIESFDQKVLDYIKKDLKVEDAYTAIDLLKKEKIIPEINLMFGVCPFETKEKLKETIKKAIDLKAKYALFSIATPFPGTELEQKAKDEGWLIGKDYETLIKTLDPGSKSLLSFPQLSNKDLEEIVRYAKIKFYFRPSYIFWRLTEIKSFPELWMLTKTAFKILLLLK